MGKRSKRSATSGGHLFYKGVLPEYRKYVRALPCLLRDGAFMWTPGAALPSTQVSHVMRLAFSDAAHVRSRGAGGNDEANLVPLCRDHHQEQHRIGIRSFETRYGLDLKAEAHALWAQYVAERGSP
jgi:hypothetical protein